MGNYITTKINQTAFPPVNGVVMVNENLLYRYLPPLGPCTDEIVILHSYGNMETCEGNGFKHKIEAIMKRMKHVSFILYDYPTRADGTNEIAVNEKIVNVYEDFRKTKNSNNNNNSSNNNNSNNNNNSSNNNNSNNNNSSSNNKKKIYLFGRSIGCVPTCHLVNYLIQKNRINEIQGVILQSPMCSAFSMFFPFCHDCLCFTPLPCLDQLNNLRIIQQNQTAWPRTMIICGNLDKLVSPLHSRHLFNFICENNKKNILLTLTKKGHDDIQYDSNATDSPLNDIVLFVI